MEFGKGKQLLELPSVQQAIDDAAAWVGAEYGRRFGNGARAAIGYRHPDRPMESPLEAIFFAWFGAAASLLAPEVYGFNLLPQEDVELSNGKRYRFDFRVQFGPPDTFSRAEQRGVPQPKLVVELDGHDFHERTKEQVAYRNERDRGLLADGWTVLHFSGSELYKDPIKCANEVFEVCFQMQEAFSNAVYNQPASA